MAEPVTENDSVLVIAAHPDDIDFGAAGYVALMRQHNVNVTYAVVTDGQLGGSDLSVSREEMAKLRRQEQISAAKVVGVKDVRFLGFFDGEVKADFELRRAITELVREIRPKRVIAPSPDRAWQRLGASHPDHLAVGEAVVSVIYPDARNPFAYPELLQKGLEAFIVKELWLMGSPYAFCGPKDSEVLIPGADLINPDIYRGELGTFVTAVDVSKTFSYKVNALKAHESQTKEINDLEGLLRSWLSHNGRIYKNNEELLCEAFQVVYLT